MRAARPGRRTLTLLCLLPLCAAVALADEASRPGVAAQQPTASVADSDGAFAQTNSRAGMPVLAAAEIGPGDSVSGSVTIANTGTLGGAFSLSARDIVDTPSAGGLARRLVVEARDLASSAPLYQGALSELEAVPVGYIAPGASRSYAIIASFPHGSGDNAYAGSGASFRLVWDGVEAAPPAETKEGAPPADTQHDLPPADAQHGAPPPPPPLRLRVWTPRIQRVLAHKRLLIRAHCNRPCRIALRGSVRIGERSAPLRTRLTHVLRADTARPRVRVPLGLRRDAARALHDRRDFVYRLTFSARDESGGRVVVRRRLTLHPLRHAKWRIFQARWRK